MSGVPSGGDRLAGRRALGARREKEIREGLAPGCVWIAFPSSYARQLLRELDLTRRELFDARSALSRLSANPPQGDAAEGPSPSDGGGA